MKALSLPLVEEQVDHEQLLGEVVGDKDQEEVMVQEVEEQVVMVQELEEQVVMVQELEELVSQVEELVSQVEELVPQGEVLKEEMLLHWMLVMLFQLAKDHNFHSS